MNCPYCPHLVNKVGHWLVCPRHRAVQWLPQTQDHSDVLELQRFIIKRYKDLHHHFMTKIPSDMEVAPHTLFTLFPLFILFKEKS